MIRRLVRAGLALGVIGGVASAVSKLRTSLGGPTAAGTATPTKPLPHPVPSATAWVEPSDGGCPASHPVKAKLSSKIFHLPGMANYERTSPDRCYLDATHAEADGLRAAKR